MRTEPVQIRRLTENDAAQLWRLRLDALESEPQAFRETAAEHRERTIPSYAQQLRDGADHSPVFGAFNPQQQLIGMVGLYTNQPGHGCIWGMYVTGPHRKAGIGARLLEAILEEARTIPAMRQVHLTVARSQQSARALYLRCGFAVAPEKPTTACGGNLPEDQDHMILCLQAS